MDNQATYQGYENEADFRLLPETQKLMSRRTQHALLRAGYYTAEQLMMASSGELMLIKNFGKQSLIEVTQWREHLMQNDQSIYNETLQSVIEAMNATNSVTTERRAEAAMATIWRLIARSPFTATRVRQMLVVPGTADV